MARLVSRADHFLNLSCYSSTYLEEAVLMCVEADQNGNVQKAFDLKLETKYRYTAAGEYLIFGGVEPQVGLLSLSFRLT